MLTCTVVDNCCIHKNAELRVIEDSIVEQNTNKWKRLSIIYYMNAIEVFVVNYISILLQQ
jgi:hypothetical protein